MSKSKPTDNVACTPDGMNAFRASFVHDNLDHLLGQVLTIVDAAITDVQQNKATKDLIRNTFANKHDWISEASFINIERSVDAPRAGPGNLHRTISGISA